MTVVRSIVFNIAFFIWSALVGLVMLPTLGGPGNWIVHWCRLWHSGTELMLSALCDIKVEIRGKEFIPTGPALVAAKHQCTFDAFAPLTQLPFPCTVAKQELLAIPLFAWYASRGNLFLTVDREGHAKALRDMLKKVKRRWIKVSNLLFSPKVRARQSQLLRTTSQELLAFICISAHPVIL